MSPVCFEDKMGEGVEKRGGNGYIGSDFIGEKRPGDP